MLRLSVVVAVVAIVPLVLPGTSLAKRKAIDFKFECACSCMIDVPPNHSYEGPANYDGSVANCASLNGKTCNREVTNNDTGVTTVRSGRLDFCAAEVVPGEEGARAQTLDPGEPQGSPALQFNKQLILQTPAVEPGKKPKKKPAIVVPLDSVTTSPQ